MLLFECMKIQPITISYLQPNCKKVQKKSLQESKQIDEDIPVLPLNYYSSNVSFGKIKNSEPLRKLFAYGIPDLYSEIITVDPKRIAKMMKTDAFEVPLKKFIQVFKPFEVSLFKDTNETKLYEIIKEQAEANPDMDVKGVVQKIAPIHLKRLRKKQGVIFKDLDELAQKLPESHRYRYKLLRSETQDKLDYKPVVVRFSSKEFKYKLAKISEYVAQRKDLKSDKTMQRLIKEAEKLPSSSSYNAIEKQKKIIEDINILLQTSTLSKNEQLNDLIKVSRDRLNNKKVVVPFSRKNFLYDLDKLTSGIQDKALRDEMLNLAETLPSSSNSLSAFIVKIQNESSEKIAYRILDPSMASVEHLTPASLGGEDELYNFACASRKENTERGNLLFTTQLKKRPLTKIYAQRQMDKYIELANQGVFEKCKMPLSYIEDFKNKMNEKSQGRIVLDTSKLKPTA